ncbi:UNVERIFIED_CONTAM: hypothetical protein HHA_307575 [Hammondia hammondi]|eukprot:XP_008888853.1 hypothetical protein HHA_307575 [Hammondia hammondi]
MGRSRQRTAVFWLAFSLRDQRGRTEVSINTSGDARARDETAFVDGAAGGDRRVTTLANATSISSSLLENSPSLSFFGSFQGLLLSWRFLIHRPRRGRGEARWPKSFSDREQF